jgi:DUF4097 and DUF4098 domain-containing protein YvlB
MKRSTALMGITLAVCAIAGAQNTGNRIVVPPRDGNRARTVQVSLVHGNVTVNTHAAREVIIENKAEAASKSRPEQKVDGLRRIDVPMNDGFQVEESDNTILINASRQADLTITVPTDTSLKLTTVHGDITVTGVHGEVVTSDTHGDVILTGISGTVVADMTNGSLKVVMDRVDPSKPLAFSSVNGGIDVTLPADLKANLKLKALRGEIYSDFEMKLASGQPINSRNNSGDGRYRWTMDRTMYGTINGGGVEASFNTVNGRIMIRKK